ncbi:transposase family protein [Synechococcus sp. PCC 7502]|uniref:IS701 family transposase n=1 Tax=Synechococcus sp. PCC 7502 TaxID=1173263 RepID=UPI00029FE4C8|nr:transposase [Synechococcus sp. PCC 7502]AFY73269.1 transposase family protein [Synechococcus sp. PCC 7502]
MSKKFTTLDYCQYLLSSQINYTITNLAEHIEGHSHDKINRYLASQRLTPRLLWQNVKSTIVSDEAEYMYVLFDDTVLDKRHAKRQYSGNEHGIVQGIGVVNCVYVNVKRQEFWVVDYRVYDPNGDGKSKLDHVSDMLKGLINIKQLPFQTVLMDSWYATQRLMAEIDNFGKIYYCPLKSNRLVDDSGGVEKYKRIDQLTWSEQELLQGKLVKINKFPKDKKGNLFWVTVSPSRTEFVVTNDLTQDYTPEVLAICSIRWKIEEFHRELKQLTGVEACQCRKSRIQRNHIACAMLVWNHLKRLAFQAGKTIYQIKFGLLSDYLKSQLINPSISMILA